MLNVGDEAGFVKYAENVVFELQSLWRTKEGMETVPVMDMSAKIEDLIYNDALADSNLSNTAQVWNKRECLIYYQETCETVLKSLEFKQGNWKKICEDNEKNPRHVLNTILKEDDGRKHKMTSSVPKVKAPRQVKPKTQVPKTVAGGVPKPKKAKGPGGRNSASKSGIAGVPMYEQVHANVGSSDNLNSGDMAMNIEMDGDLGDLGFDFENDKADDWNF